MKAIILAAGKGERLRSVEPDVPKPMVRIKGIPVLHTTVCHLREHGMDEIVITAGYKAEVIQKYFRESADVKVVYEPKPLGTAGGFKAALDSFGGTTDPVLVWHGDNVSTCNPQRMLEYHKASNSDATIAVCWRKDPGRSGIVEWDITNHIVSFEEKPHGLTYGWVSAGIYILEPHRVLPFIPSIGDFGHDVFPKLLYERSMYAYGFSHDEYLRWYDTPEDLARLCADY